MSVENVTRAAERTFALYAVYGISVEGVLDTTVQEACRGDRISSYRRVRLSTFGRVRGAGFALLATFDHPHFTLVLADLSELTVARLDRCFDEPIAFLVARFRSADLQASLERITRSPHRRWVTVDQRRALNRGLPKSGSSARRLQQPGPSTARPAHLTHLPMTRLPRTLQHHETVVSYDTPPNRFVRFALKKWQGIALDLQQTLQATPVGAGPRARGLDETRWLAERCEQLLARSPFDEADDMRAFPHGDPVLLRQPGYRDVLRTYSLAEASIALDAVLPDDPFSATQRNVATLYEYWCFVAMMRCISELCSTEPTGVLFEVNRSGLSLVLRQGEASKLSWEVEIQGRRLALDLWFNRDFRREDPRADHSSWAAAMRPDISLRVRPRSARPGYAVDPELDVWLHFDANYSVDGVIGVDAVITDDPPDVVAKRADVLKMHAYRDAIRRSAGAYVLYPGSGALQHRKEHHEILPGIGAFPLRPNEHGQINGLTSVTEFLREVLDHAANQASAAERSQFWQAMHARASGRRVAPSSGLMLPPADERVLVGFVRGDQREWVRRTRQYNVRADERRGAVRITDDMITARLLVLWAGRVDGRGELIGVFERTGPWQVASADDLHARGYPVREAAARYLVASINTVSPSAEAVLASRVSNFSVAERSAPHSLTWAALMSLQ